MFVLNYCLAPLDAILFCLVLARDHFLLVEEFSLLIQDQARNKEFYGAGVQNGKRAYHHFKIVMSSGISAFKIRRRGQKSRLFSKSSYLSEPDVRPSSLVPTQYRFQGHRPSSSFVTLRVPQNASFVQLISEPLRVNVFSFVIYKRGNLQYPEQIRAVQAT